MLEKVGALQVILGTEALAAMGHGRNFPGDKALRGHDEGFHRARWHRYTAIFMLGVVRGH